MASYLGSAIGRNARQVLTAPALWPASIRDYGTGTQPGDVSNWFREKFKAPGWLLGRETAPDTYELTGTPKTSEEAPVTVVAQPVANGLRGVGGEGSIREMELVRPGEPTVPLVVKRFAFVGDAMAERDKYSQMKELQGPIVAEQYFAAKIPDADYGEPLYVSGMRLYPARCLSTVLEAGALSRAEAIAISLRVEALRQALGRGRGHGDLKPANIFVEDRDRLSDAVLGDVAGPSGNTFRPTRGTRGYGPERRPETVLEQDNLGHAAIVAEAWGATLNRADTWDEQALPPALREALWALREVGDRDTLQSLLMDWAKQG